MPGQAEIPIELARVADAPVIARLSRHLIEDGLDWSWKPDRVLASIRSRTTLVIVARDAGRIVGFAIMRYGDEEAHLDLLAVDPDYRRAGLGRRLLEWLEKAAVIAGITVVYLEVRASRLGAQAFYQRMGYRQRSVFAHYYQGQESAIRMGRELGYPRGSEVETSVGLFAEVSETLARAARGQR